jgi:NADPH2:quinone reductase
VYAQQFDYTSRPTGGSWSRSTNPTGSGLVVVDLHAAGVSFPDLLQTTGSYHTVRELPFVLDVEGAGVVRTARG